MIGVFRAAAFGLGIVLYVMAPAAIVVALQTVGNILVLALLVTPSAAARFLTDRIGAMIGVGASIAPFGAIAGPRPSFYYNLAAGGLIVLVITGRFLLARLLAPGAACSPAGGPRRGPGD